MSSNFSRYEALEKAYIKANKWSEDGDLERISDLVFEISEFLLKPYWEILHEKEGKK